MQSPPPARIDDYLNIEDQIRLILNNEIGSTGKNYVATTIGDLASKLKEDRAPVYQALSRLKTKGEIEFDKEDEDNRNRIVGIKVIKLAPSGRTYIRAAERGKADVARAIESGPDLTENTGALVEYIRQKTAILRMREQAVASGLNPDDTVKFEPIPLAEEAIFILQQYNDLKVKYDELIKEYRMQQFDLEAAQRDVQYLKRKDRQELIAAVN